jgi:nucleoid-associated protein YgaU
MIPQSAGSATEQQDIHVKTNLDEELKAEWGEAPAAEELTVEPVSASTVSEEATVEAPNAELATESASEQPEAAPAVTEAPAPSKAQPKPGVLTLTPALQTKAVKDITLADTTDYTISGTMLTHKLKSGETIIQLSNKYYGDKRLWPYIVKHNRMKNFNSVAIGQAIQIPVLEAR